MFDYIIKYNTHKNRSYFKAINTKLLDISILKKQKKYQYIFFLLLFLNCLRSYLKVVIYQKLQRTAEEELSIF